MSRPAPPAADRRRLARELRSLAFACSRAQLAIAEDPDLTDVAQQVATARRVLESAAEQLGAVARARSAPGSAPSAAPDSAPASGPTAGDGPGLPHLVAYADALLATDFEECARLAEQWPEPLRHLQSLRELLTRAAAALSEQRWMDAVPAVRLLAHRLAPADPGTGTGPPPCQRQALLHVVAARLALRSEQPDRALEELRLADDLVEDRVPYHAALSEYLLAQHEPVQAEDRAMRAHDGGPDRPDGLVARARCAEMQGEDPSDLYLAAAEAAFTTGDPVRAVTALLAPTPPRLLLHLGELALTRGEGTLALRVVECARTVAEAAELEEDTRLRQNAALADLRARALGVTGAPVEEQAAELVNAGRHSAWANDIATARDRLGSALALTPDHADALYTLTDVLRTASGTSVPPYVDAELLDEAAACWRRAIALRPPSSAWEHRVAASLSEAQALVPQADRNRRTWEAVSHLEEALALDPLDGWAFRGLSNLYERLELYACGLRAVARFEELEPGAADAAEQRVILLTNAGRPKEALAALERVQDRGWAETVRAAVVVDHGRPEELPDAVAALESNAADPEAQLWVWDYLITAYRLAGRASAARATAEALWGARERYDASDRDSALAMASALMVLGRFEEALTQLERQADDPTGYPRRARKAALCRLALGDTGAAEQLFRGIAAERTPGDWRAFLDDLALVEEAVTGPARAEVAPILDQGRSLAERRRGETPRLRSAEEELHDVVTDLGVQPTAARRAARAGLARLAQEDGRWQEAVDHLAALREEQPDPLSDALARLLGDRLIELGDTRLTEADTGGALAAYDDALVALGPAAGGEQLVGLHARRAFASCLAGGAEVEQELARAVAATGAEPEQAGATLAEVTGGLLRSVGDYWAVVDAWEAAVHAAEAPFGAALRAAGDGLLTALDRLLLGEEDSAEPPDTVRRVVVDLGADLVPEDTEGWPLLQRTIPDMRARLVERLGMTLPGVLLRSAPDLPADEYAVLVDEAVAATGHGEPVRQAGSTVPPQPALADHLESTLLLHTDALFGVEDFEVLFQEAVESGDGPSVSRLLELLPDPVARVRCARLLARLLGEGVPILGWSSTVLEAASLSAPLWTLDAAEDRVRNRVKESLPGNQPDVARFRVPPAWDSALSTPTGVVSTELGPIAIHGMMRRLDQWWAGERAAGSPVALVTGSTPARRRLRALSHARWPDLMVQTLAETLDEGSVQPLSAEPVSLPSVSVASPELERPHA